MTINTTEINANKSEREPLIRKIKSMTKEREIELNRAPPLFPPIGIYK